MSEQELQALVVDDEAELRRSVRTFVEREGFQVTECDNGKKAVSLAQGNDFDLVIMDVKMPEMDGLQALHHIKETNPSSHVVIVTAHANIEDAKTAIREGAFDYLEKPVREADVLKMIEKVKQSRGLAQKVMYSAPIVKLDSEDQFVGTSYEMRQIFSLINRLSQVNTSVLIRGENGTGKELVARAIHFNSPRKDKPFVAVNCAAIPENLIESELFGHEKGAFTGADARKIGKFQYATGGTLFLDEIGDISPSMQVKLLRVLQERLFMPVGSNREIKTDARILAATNRNLEELIKQGKFREDLFYRLNVMPIYLPPLRERIQDIQPLATQFIKQFNEVHHREIEGLSPDALKVLTSYAWPGNIRELENAIEYAFIIEQSPQIQMDSLPPSVRGQAAVSKTAFPEKSMGSESGYRATKESFEREFILQALRANHGKINQTAERARIPKNTLLRKIKKYNIQPEEYEDSGDDK